ELITDNFAVLRSGGILSDVESSTTASNGLRNAFVNGTGGSIQRGFVRQGFGLVSEQDRNRYEAAARLQNIWGKNTIKYGIELTQNRYRIDTHSTGPTRNFGAPVSGIFNGFRATNNWGVCSGDTTTKVITCPSSTFTTRTAQMITNGDFGTQYTSAATGTLATVNVANPILILSTVSVRDFRLTTHGAFSKTNTESF